MKWNWAGEAKSRTTGSTTIEHEQGGVAVRPSTEPRRQETDGRVPADPWVVILAGGEGRRLQSVTSSGNGVMVPKQFCRFRDDRTLLATTVDRALRITRRDRIIAVVVEPHRHWWQRDLDRLPRENVLAQPLNRGTAIAILHALVELHMRESRPSLILMPSDHDVEDENVLQRTVLLAHRTAAEFPEDLVLLGIPPSHLDSEYGLVVPDPDQHGPSRAVRTFVEKPSLSVASRLAREGALWNTFIFACSGGALYDRFQETLPSTARTYLAGLLAHEPRDPDWLRILYEHLPAHDFGRDVLQRSATGLRMIAVPPCGWTDLGTPARLAAWLDVHRDAMFWREHPLMRAWPGGGWTGILEAS